MGNMSTMKSRNHGIALLLVILALSANPGLAAEQEPSSKSTDFVEMSLEDLMDIEVTSVSKRPEKRHEAAAAIFVITQEDIRRSGAATIPEALRMAPGVQVQRINANRWSITVRGFNGLYANKLLVLVDGRTVYSPLFSGVYWETQDTLLEDIDRIEVIRGPGATLWGANAVNGVINIITKPASETQGGLLTLGGGTEERGFGSIRYGSHFGQNGFWRVYAKYFNRDGFVDGSGHDTEDDWRAYRAGFRLDNAFEVDRLTLQGEVYDGRAGQSVTIPLPFPPVMHTFDSDFDIAGGHLLGRWSRRLSDDADIALQAYYDYSVRDEATFEERRHTVDLDFQHRRALGTRHEFLWGLGYRYTTDDTAGSFVFMLDPENHEDHLFSAFVQDTITLVEERLRLTVGTKFEHNDHSGFEIQPTLRLLWTPNETHTVWAAVSRAVQTPSRSEHDMRINVARFPLGLVSLVTHSGVDSEKLLASEIGYRVRPTKNLFLDLTAFYNIYDDLRTWEPLLPFFEVLPLPPHLAIHSRLNNNMEGEVYGIEISADWQAARRWRLSAAYSFLEMNLRLDGSSQDTTSIVQEDRSPHHQAHLISHVDLPHQLELDTEFYYVDRLSGTDIPSYVRFDVRLGWRPREDLEVSVSWQDILDARHPEYGVFEGVNSTEAERGIYGKVTWRF